MSQECKAEIAPLTKFLPDGTEYKEESLSYEASPLPGDRLVFISRMRPPRNTEIHNSVVTVRSVSPSGGISVEETEFTGAFMRECFHEIVQREVDLSDFDSVFV